MPYDRLATRSTFLTNEKHCYPALKSFAYVPDRQQRGCFLSLSDNDPKVLRYGLFFAAWSLEPEEELTDVNVRF